MLLASIAAFNLSIAPAAGEVELGAVASLAVRSPIRSIKARAKFREGIYEGRVLAPDSYGLANRLYTSGCS